MVTITETVNLSLTDRIVPQIIYAKQGDNMTRLIECKLYSGTEQHKIGSSGVASVSGVRPDGVNFSYSSDDNPDIAYVSDSCVYFWITSDMTAAVGEFKVNVTAEASGEVIGAFGLVLRVERSASF